MVDNKLIGERLKSARIDRHMNQTDVATAVHVATSTIARYERGEIDRLKMPVVEAIANVLNVNPEWILGKSQDKIRFPANAIPVGNSPTINIPVIGRVAAGVECFAEENIIGYEQFPTSEIVPGEQYACLRVVGDSMYPKFEEGDTVLVRVQSSVDSGSFAVVIVDGEDGIIKRVVYDDDYIELQSINPMYPPRRFENADVLRVRVFGLVKEIKRKF